MMIKVEELYQICKEYVEVCEEYPQELKLIGKIDNSIENIEDFYEVVEKSVGSDVDMLDIIYRALKIKQKADKIYDFILDDVEKKIKQYEEENL